MGEQGYTLDAAGEWLLGVPRLPSPNADARPPGADIELLVVHGISLPPGLYGGPFIDLLFTNALPASAHPSFAGLEALRVSAHLLVRRDGALTQYVPFSQRAWHAGVSSWRGRPRCNDYSIGIELEGSDEEPYEFVQYVRLAAVARCLMRRWPRLTPESIVGHADIAPGRKTDPGPAFDWRRLSLMLAIEPDAGDAHEGLLQ